MVLEATVTIVLEPFREASCSQIAPFTQGVFLNGELCGDRACAVPARDEDVRRVTERVVDDGDVHTPPVVVMTATVTHLN